MSALDTVVHGRSKPSFGSPNQPDPGLAKHGNRGVASCTGDPHSTKIYEAPANLLLPDAATGAIPGLDDGGANDCVVELPGCRQPRNARAKHKNMRIRLHSTFLPATSFDPSKQSVEIACNHLNGNTVGMEQRVFVVSLVGTIAFAALGFVGYFLSGSGAILLDAIFTLIGMPIAIISIVVVRAARRAPTPDYPIGLVQARPMLEVFKSLFLLGLLVAVVADAVQSIIAGGRVVSGLFAVAYAAVAALGCLVVALIIALVGRGSDTSLVKLERAGWLQDAGISAGIGVAFAVVTWVPFPWVQAAAPYLDQGLIILIALAFAPVYVRTLITSGRELLLGAPKERVRNAITRVVAECAGRFGYKGVESGVVSTAGTLIVDVTLTVEDDTLSMKHASEVRREISEAVKRSAAEMGSKAIAWVSFEEPASASVDQSLKARTR